MLTEKQIKQVQKKVEPTRDEPALCEAFRILGIGIATAWWKRSLRWKNYVW